MNVLVDFSAVINVLTSEIMLTLGLHDLKLIPTVVELADRSKIRPIGKLEDIMISMDCWHYPIDLLVFHTQYLAGGHPLILGCPWLTTVDAYIGCQLGNMIIYNGENMKNIILYPPTERSSQKKPKHNSLSLDGIKIEQ